jgi:enediyne biosynthesis thioesterase
MSRSPLPQPARACPGSVADAYYEYRHVIDIEDTNHAGNAHRVSYSRWQGRCLELFLLEHVPVLLEEFRDLRILVTKSGCTFFTGIQVFDEVSVRMRVDEITPTQIGLVFDHLRSRGGATELAARGWQHVACLRGADADLWRVAVPEPLRAALRNYTINKPRRAGHDRPAAGTGARTATIRQPITVTLRNKETA